MWRSHSTHRQFVFERIASVRSVQPANNQAKIEIKEKQEMWMCIIHLLSKSEMIAHILYAHTVSILLSWMFYYCHRACDSKKRITWRKKTQSNPEIEAVKYKHWNLNPCHKCQTNLWRGEYYENVFQFHLIQFIIPFIEWLKYISRTKEKKIQIERKECFFLRCFFSLTDYNDFVCTM